MVRRFGPRSGSVQLTLQTFDFRCELGERFDAISVRCHGPQILRDMLTCFQGTFTKNFRRAARHKGAVVADQETIPARTVEQGEAAIAECAFVSGSPGGCLEQLFGSARVPLSRSPPVQELRHHQRGGHCGRRALSGGRLERPAIAEASAGVYSESRPNQAQLLDFA
jgi:hypothetical protein